MDYFEISNKEKIESQLFGDGVSEEEVINELSQQLEDIPTSEATASTNQAEEDVSDEIKADDINSNHIENETDDEVVESIDTSKPE